MSIPELIALAWDAHLDAGRDISDPRFVSIVRRFSVADRWAIVNGVEALQRVPLRVSGIRHIPTKSILRRTPAFTTMCTWQIPPNFEGEGCPHCFGHHGWVWLLPARPPVSWYSPSTRVREWARFRLGCLEVWASMSLAEFADRNRHRVIDKSAVWTDIDAEYATIRSHWCGQRGRPKDDELRLIRTWLDHRPVGDRSTNLDRGRMMVVLDKYDAKREPKPSRNQWMIAVLDRWTSVSAADRERWTRPFGYNLDITPARSARRTS